MRPKITVIMPMLNSKPYLRECMDSVVNQTLKELEILCIDAGSTDGTLEILGEYASRDSRIQIVNSDKKSYGYQVNLGLDLAQGEYIGIVESDDYIAEDMYQILYDLAVKHDLDSVKSDHYTFRGSGDARAFTYLPLMQDQKYYHTILNPSNDTNLFQANNLNQPGIYSLTLIQKYHIRLAETPGASYQDNCLWFQIFAHSERMYFCQKPLYMLRRDNENSSVMSTGKVFCVCDVYAYIRNTLRGTGDFEKKYAPICALYMYHNYVWTVNRVANEYKLAFLYKFSFDFNNLNSSGELKRELFSEYQWNCIQEIMRDPYQYCCAHFGRAISCIANAEVAAIHASWSYRIGRAVTWLPRKVRGGIRCFREHGFRYTMRRVLVHLHLAEDESKRARPKPAPAAAPAAEKAPEKKPAPIKKDYQFYAQLPPEKYEEELKLWFKSKTGNDLDLETPKTFKEKIQWLKLYDSTPIKTRLADKYLVRDWIKEKIGEEYLIPLLGVWDSFDEIDFDKLPDQFVLKANHGCGWNIIVKDKSKLDIEGARIKFDRWINRRYSFAGDLELHYMNIPPKIIAEKYIEEMGQLYDYKLACFGGEVKYIQVHTERNQSNLREFRTTIFTKEWEQMPVRLENYPPADHDIPRPKNLAQMIRFAEILSQGFALVRVDFYEISGHIYFGEMTFTPGSGVTKVVPEEFDDERGSWIELPPKSPFPKRQF